MGKQREETAEDGGRAQRSWARRPSRRRRRRAPPPQRTATRRGALSRIEDRRGQTAEAAGSTGRRWQGQPRVAPGAGRARRARVWNGERRSEEGATGAGLGRRFESGEAARATGSAPPRGLHHRRSSPREAVAALPRHAHVQLGTAQLHLRQRGERARRHARRAEVDIVVAPTPPSRATAPAPAADTLGQPHLSPGAKAPGDDRPRRGPRIPPRLGSGVAIGQSPITTPLSAAAHLARGPA